MFNKEKLQSYINQYDVLNHTEVIFFENTDDEISWNICILNKSLECSIEAFYAISQKKGLIENKSPDAKKVFEDIISEVYFKSSDALTAVNLIKKWENMVSFYRTLGVREEFLFKQEEVIKAYTQEDDGIDEILLEFDDKYVYISIGLY